MLFKRGLALLSLSIARLIFCNDHFGWRTLRRLLSAFPSVRLCRGTPSPRNCLVVIFAFLLFRSTGLNNANSYCMYGIKLLTLQALKTMLCS